MREDKKVSLFRELQEAVRRLLRKREKPPEGDPYANVPAPLLRGPKGRSGAAVAEIEEDLSQNFSSRKQ
jgi:hypothetical protein